MKNLKQETNKLRIKKKKKKITTKDKKNEKLEIKK